jgi:anaerobic ribonucleoside-triphosphate reductase activating protein
MKVRLHAVELGSRANGPGLRAAVWFQGCTLACPGCFNPDTHDAGGGYEADTESLAGDIAGAGGIEGVSISGGEPFQQPEALEDLLRRLRATPLSILVFSGYTLERIRALPRGAEILANIDVLIAGPYVEARHLGRGLLGSANQRLHLLTSLYKLTDFAALPNCEVILHRDGTVTVSGVAPLSQEVGVRR